MISFIQAIIFTETRNIALPNLPEGMEWKKVMDTGDLTCDGFYGENGQVYEKSRGGGTTYSGCASG